MLLVFSFARPQVALHSTKKHNNKSFTFIEYLLPYQLSESYMKMRSYRFRLTSYHGRDVDIITKVV
jgi:hypothetical protein